MRAALLAALVVAVAAATALTLWRITAEAPCHTPGGSPLAAQPCTDGGGQP